MQQDQIAPPQVAAVTEPLYPTQLRMPQPERLALSASLMAFLSACGGGGSDTASPAAVAPPTSTPSSTPSSTPISQAAAARFLLQAQMSASDVDIAAVQAQGYSAWLLAQMSAPISETGWDWLMRQGYNVEGAVFSSAPADYMAWNQLIASPDAVRKRLALAWTEIMVVSSNSMAIQYRSFAMAAYWDTLNASVLGTYRSLLENITLNLAMGSYLNTRGNLKENPATGAQPDENYAREVLQLFSIGLVELEANGQPKLVAGQPKETYSQTDITNLARVFTGYDYDLTGHVTFTNPLRVRNPMALNPAKHSNLQASFLRTTIPANTEGRVALKTALDTIADHPNVGPFIAKQLINRLVTSNPSPAYVQRVASVFNKPGARGDLRAVTAAVLLDDDARGEAALTVPTAGKLREPILRFVQWARSFNASSASDRWRIVDQSNSATQLGQSPLRSPSVFNFFRPGYIPPNTAMAAQQLTAPEFQIANESTVAAYVNFMTTVVRSGTADVKSIYATEMALAGDPAGLLKRLNLLLTANQLSTGSVALIVNAVTQMPNANNTDSQNRVYAAVLLVMACPEYLVQK